mmetsp:Transcript_3940/g.8479  ORF Transcript_3940/g.8479 Transcript_3940/m.8479 type:complete len:90 (+) Transcript_3940:223-492(+)
MKATLATFLLPVDESLSTEFTLGVDDEDVPAPASAVDDGEKPERNENLGLHVILLQQRRRYSGMPWYLIKFNSRCHSNNRMAATFDDRD